MRRLTKQVGTKVDRGACPGTTVTVTTYTYSAWDPYGRPTAGVVGPSSDLTTET